VSLDASIPGSEFWNTQRDKPRMPGEVLHVKPRVRFFSYCPACPIVDPFANRKEEDSIAFEAVVLLFPSSFSHHVDLSSDFVFFASFKLFHVATTS
jgi:hypothetical protein